MSFVSGLPDFPGLMLSSHANFEGVPAGDRVVHGDGIPQVHQSPPLRQAVPEAAGLHVDGQLAEGRLVQGGVLLPLLEDHLGVHASRPAQDDLGAPDLKGGGGALQPGQSALLVREEKAPLSRGRQGALGHQFDAVGLHVLKMLLRPDGQQNRQRVRLNTGQCRSSVPCDGCPPAKRGRPRPRSPPPGR